MPDPTKSDSSQTLTPSFGTGDSSAQPPSFADPQTQVEPPIETKVENVATDQKSSSPPMDIPPIITPSDGGKKFGGGMGKTIATIFGILILVLGLGAGVLLIRQQQDIREKASVTPPDQECSPGEYDRICTGNDAGCCPGGGEAEVRQCDASGRWGASFGECRGECASDSCGSGTQQICTPGEFKRTCTGACGGCATDAGEAKIEQCNSSGTAWEEKQSECRTECSGPCAGPPGGNCITTTVSSDPQCKAGGPAEVTLTFTNSCNYLVTVPYTGGSKNCDRPAGSVGCSACTLTESAKTIDVPANDSRDATESCDPGACETCQVDISGGGKSAGAAAFLGGDCGGGGTPPSTSAQCLNVQAYDINWVKITDLSTLKIGDKVRFTVEGSASSGTFDKARFLINGETRPEVTGKRPNTNEFFDEYTIPPGVANFTIKGQVHHKELNSWL